MKYSPHKKANRRKRSILHRRAIKTIGKEQRNTNEKDNGGACLHSTLRSANHEPNTHIRLSSIAANIYKCSFPRKRQLKVADCHIYYKISYREFGIIRSDPDHLLIDICPERNLEYISHASGISVRNNEIGWTATQWIEI